MPDAQSSLGVPEDMNTYRKRTHDMLASFTDQGIRKVNDSPKRADAFKRSGERVRSDREGCILDTRRVRRRRDCRGTRALRQGRRARHSGPIIVTGWSAGGHLTSFILDHPKVAAGLAISGVFDLGALRDSPHVNDKVKLSEEEIQKLSPMRRSIVNKPLGIAYGTGELPAMIASSRDYHAYPSQGHVPGDLIPIANTNHFTILDELRQHNSTLTRAVIAWR
jgi:hypothetical protein